ncbi:Cleavage stimulation factor subunit 3 [Eumeta japonica]|uniref:Cleavage stimulation factor subunit 3 n=1 Tax=Eumeta variegata TaxID=151549 RepID=A0A4C1WDX5_EUMVA|nr:Cleavage stimulation factor subunit 3 [Eumeta japonica]
MVWEQLFQRCLMKILNIELWRLYLNYVKETKCMLPTYNTQMDRLRCRILTQYGHEVIAFAVAFRLMSESFCGPLPLRHPTPPPLAHFLSVRHPVHTQKTGNAFVTRLRSRMFMGCSDHLLYWIRY